MLTQTEPFATDVTEWIDISIPFRNGMLYWPSDPVPKIVRMKDANAGDKVTLTDLHFISHSGTHIDAPLHFIRNGVSIDKMPLDTAVGIARVIEIKDQESIKPEELKLHNIQKGERILFKTKNSSWIYDTDEFHKKYVFLTPESAEYLVTRGIRLVGLDYITVSAYETENEYASIPEYQAKSGIHRTHRALLGNGIYIMENINLVKAKAGYYELIALPIRLENGDAGLTRAILIPLNKEKDTPSDNNIY
jgi:arylformamidase